MKIFLTEHIKYPHIDTPRIYATDWSMAETNCPKSLKVIGELIEEGYIDLENEFPLN